jgi:hypothetical protein
MISMRMYYLIKEHSNGNISEEDIINSKSQKEIDQDELLKFLIE